MKKPSIYKNDLCEILVNEIECSLDRIEHLKKRIILHNLIKRFIECVHLYPHTVDLSRNRMPHFTQRDQTFRHVNHAPGVGLPSHLNALENKLAHKAMRTIQPLCRYNHDPSECSDKCVCTELTTPE